MTSKRYADSGITKRNYPELKTLSDNTFQQKWLVSLKKNTPQKPDLDDISKKLSFEGFNIAIEDLSEKNIQVIVNTAYSETDYLFLNTSNLFAEIDCLLCGIELIQSQERNEWFPWLSERSGQSFNINRIIIHEIDVGLRISLQQGVSFFGIEKVNEVLLKNSRVISVNPGGALTKKSIDSDGNNSFEISGFFLTIRLHEYQPSLSNWTNSKTTTESYPK
ncbi:hypothetical protein Lepto7376_4092 [[Leptolyngbya] sp. PCC 7376]|uniref:hypothetical protein n=1 Tax=[Leptolyngbya] sp. PCC 7376 TaxID=111781 RepID=UPI00029F0678|nr:hypothetical protein [[Leptolyngbya] sp. PCC 7376]AFY40221.1 hypothetical protein Lepto7376_4092 [[Leptolyngbya] sp. PCC 7376]